MKQFFAPSTLPAAAGSRRRGRLRHQVDNKTPRLGRTAAVAGQLRRLVFTAVLGIIIPVLLTEVLEKWYAIPANLEWFLHCVVLVATLTPVFYCLWYRPLAGEMAERAQAELEVRRLSRQVMEASEDERRRLARDLHDDIGQKLVALQMQLDLHRQNLDDRYPELVGECRQIGAVIGGLADDLRHVIVALRPPLLDDLGLLPALEAHLADLRRLCPALEVQLIASGMGGRLPVELETVLFRVSQEALNNVVRHARARRVEIRLTGSYPTIILIVEDDGIGFPAGAPGAGSGEGQHCGLSGLRERVAAVGGWLKVQSAPGKGTRLRAEVPLSVGR